MPLPYNQPIICHSDIYSVIYIITVCHHIRDGNSCLIEIVSVLKYPDLDLF